MREYKNWYGIFYGRARDTTPCITQFASKTSLATSKLLSLINSGHILGLTLISKHVEQIFVDWGFCIHFPRHFHICFTNTSIKMERIVRLLTTRTLENNADDTG